MVNIDQQIVDTLTDLWGIPSPGPDNLLSAPAFRKLSDLCEQHYGGGKAVFALNNALRSLGLPCGQPYQFQQSMHDFAAIAKKLALAFTRKTTHRRYICPLDLADELPPMSFGHARIGKLNADELGEMFDIQRLTRHFPTLSLELDRFAYFHWLIVEEEVELDARPEARVLPFLYMDMRRDQGEINPYLGRFPFAVEEALFFLLLVPWENLSRYSDLDWRGFRIPWVYTLDEDLFVSPTRPPAPDSLSLEPWMLHSLWGEDVELEHPSILPLDGCADKELLKVTDAHWEQVQCARKKVLFETPVVHFLVRAFLANGIDEFIAHMTAIEAAVGLESDHNRKKRSKPDPLPNLKASSRVARRLGVLIEDATAANDYEGLFDLRSDFIHGRAKVESISSKKRILARSLARRAACALVQRALNLHSSRDEFLSDLLKKDI